MQNLEICNWQIYVNVLQYDLLDERRYNMTKDSLIELLYSKNLKNTLRHMRHYERLLKNGISYDEIRLFMELDYEIFLKKQEMIKSINLLDENAIYELNDIENIQTNIESNEDAICKFKALHLANDNILEYLDN